MEVNVHSYVHGTAETDRPSLKQIETDFVDSVTGANRCPLEVWICSEPLIGVCVVSGR